LAVLRWPLVAGALLLGLAVLYYVAPARKGRWRWISPGTVLATILFLAGSVAFSQYVAHFQNYNETYGSVGAVIALLMWLYLTAYFTLLGAELNHELDLETKVVAKMARDDGAR
jgi:membrane protein